jgi:hypothetical protein
MALYEITADNFTEIKQTTFGQSGHYERGDIQRLLRMQIDVILPDVLIISEEFGDWDDSRRRIDLLGIDREGNLVVIELKRTEDGGHMELQAIRYAAMVAEMTFETAVKTFQKYLTRISDERDPQTVILEFLRWLEPDESRFAQDVRLVLVSSDFSKELTTTVMWLSDMKGMDIRCIRLVPYADRGRTLIDVQQIIPLPEAADYRVRIRTKEQKENVERSERSDIAMRRNEFWQAFVDAVPEELERGGSAAYTSNRWRKMENPNLIISMMTAVDSVGVFVRAPQNGSHSATRSLLAERSTELGDKLGAPMGESDAHFFFTGLAGDYNDPSQRDELIRWLAETADRYEKVLKEVLFPASELRR